MRLLYISNGNIPSRWGHTFQTMKMAQALGRRVPEFELVIASDVAGLLRPRVDLRDWYGLRDPPRVRRLVTTWRAPSPTFERNSPSARFVRRALRWVRRQRPDAVWTRSYQVAEACMDARLPLVFETHAGPRHPHMDRIRRVGWDPHLLTLVTTLDYLRDAYLERGVPAERIAVLPNGVDAERFGPPPADRRPLRRRLGLPSDAAVVLYVGHLYPHKGIDLLMDVARLLPDVRFLLVGGWPHDIEGWRCEADLLPNVELRGFVPNAELPDLMAAADLGVSPHSAVNRAARETCPLKLFEYMAAGLPVVASGIPSLAPFVTDGVNAVVVPPDDERGLAEGIRMVLDRPALASSLAEAGRKTALDHSWDRRAARALETVGAQMAASGR